jgi:hypothetical protein
VTPVLSFQWGKPAPDTVGALKDLWDRSAMPSSSRRRCCSTPARASPMAAIGRSIRSIMVALKVGVTRTAAPDAGKEYAGTLTAAGHAARRRAARATINAAYTLRQEAQTGSLEVGKLADLIVLDRNFFTHPAEDIANIKVLQTMVGGKIVYQADGMH